jgi:hypothetical protein
MPHALFEPKILGELPLWAAVLVASRAARRFILALPGGAAGETTGALLGACDAADACAAAGQRSAAAAAVIQRATTKKGSAAVLAACEMVRWVGDAVHAANDALDFGAAESACYGSVRAALDVANARARLVGMTAIQSAILVASDVDQLLFVCRDLRVGTYNGLPRGVFERLVPVRAPEVHTADLDDPMRDDPTGGAR